ncbi:PE-PPE domain-containing protein [Mycolicibacterium pulveris]|nr:PE-PPE domain-containing protein [Mycolicibacterium pulveris]MCV6979885.1 PE-PPE domain-containing protein [Mycolicibacterium pulveris]
MTFAFVALASTTVLIMGGTGHPLSTPPDTAPYVQQYMDDAVNNFVSPASAATIPTGIPQGPYNSVAVITPEQDWPNYGQLPISESISQGLASLHSCISSNVCDYNTEMESTAPSPSDTFVVFGYSQSAAIAMLEKARLAAEYGEGEGPDVSFVVIGAPRPNGGLGARDTTGLMTFLLFGRWPDADLINMPIPTDTQHFTANAVIQYDGFSDFPLNPLNLLATVNAYMGVLLFHTTYGDHSLDDPGVIDQGQYGDTRFYLFPSEILPVLKPIQSIPVIGPALADSWDPVLRVMIESAYNRGISPGVPTPFDVLYFENPIKLATNLLLAVPIGMDNGIESLFGVRPLGTLRPGPYGVGGSDGGLKIPEPAAITAGAESVDPPVGPTSAELPSDSPEFASIDAADMVTGEPTSSESAGDADAEITESTDETESVESSSDSENTGSPDSRFADDTFPDDADAKASSTTDVDPSPALRSASVAGRSTESTDTDQDFVGDRGARRDAADQDKPRMATSSLS